MRDQYTQAALRLTKNPDYILLKNTMIDQLSTPSDSLLDKPDYIVARSYNHDAGIRNFFRWVTQTSENAAQEATDHTLRPFEHHKQATK